MDKSNTETHQSDINLPSEPVLVIEPSNGSLVATLGSLWRFRELLGILTLRDVKVRYKQTVLGILWAVIQPLFMMLIFTLFFGKLAKIPSDGIPYPIFAFTGLLPWTFFSNSLTNSSNSLVRDSSLITKIYFPRMIIPIAAVGAGLIDFLIAFGLLILLMLYYDLGFSVNFLMIPLLTLLTALSAVGLGIWTAAINVKYRDVKYVLPFLIQIGLFATPIIYPSSFVPEKWRWLLVLNPLTGIIDGFRSAIFGKSFDFLSLGMSFLMIFIILLCSLYAFQKMEREFADIV